MRTQTEHGRLVFCPEGRIDAAEAPELEREIMAVLDERPGTEAAFDMEDVEYISSAGLRVMMKLNNRQGRLLVLNARPAVYEVLDLTGLTSVFRVYRRPREISLKGCGLVGQGAVGVVYRLNDDTIVKLYRRADSLPMIHREQNRARQAFLRGIPTAIPYDVVKAGNKYGLVFEMLKADSFNDIYVREPRRGDELIETYVQVLRKIHAVEMPAGELPDARQLARDRVAALGDLLPGALAARLTELLDAMPEDLHTVHGDVHMKNVIFSDGEPLLIDMETLCTGDPVFDFAGLWVTYIAFNLEDPDDAMEFLGIDAIRCRTFFDRVVRLYLNTEDPEVLGRVVDRIRVLGVLRFLEMIALLGMGKPELKELRIARSLVRLEESLSRLDSLCLAEK